MSETTHSTAPRKKIRRIATEEAFNIPEISAALRDVARTPGNSLDLRLVQGIYDAHPGDNRFGFLEHLLDIDEARIRVMDENGRQVVKDDDVDAAPKVRFRAPRDGRYSIRLELYDARRSAFCVAAILRKGGHPVPTKNLVDATDNLIASCKTIEPKKQLSFNYHDTENVWCLFGSILEPGKGSTINVRSGRGERVFVAAADNSANHIGLSLEDKDAKPLPTIYSLDGDELKLCFPLLPKKRR